MKGSKQYYKGYNTTNSNCKVFPVLSNLLLLTRPSPIGAVGSQSEGPGFKSRRRRLDNSFRQTANGPCLSRPSCTHEYKVFLRCLPVYDGTTSATIRWCNGASPEVLRTKHLFPKGLLKNKNKKYVTAFVHLLFDADSTVSNWCQTVHFTTYRNGAAV